MPNDKIPLFEIEEQQKFAINDEDACTKRPKSKWLTNKKITFFVIIVFIVIISLIVWKVIGFVLWKFNHNGPTSDGWQGSHNCTGYSEAYPSGYGFDCPNPCPNGTESRYSSYFDVFPPHLSRKIRQAQWIMEQFGEPTYLVPRGLEHITFSYHCCYTNAQFNLIKNVLQNHTFPPIKVEMDEVVCRIDDPIKSDVSLVIQLTQQSNRALVESIESIEAKIQEIGLPAHVPRAQQQPYHITLGVVTSGLGPNGNKTKYTLYPVQSVLKEINTVIPPGTWLGNEILVLERPCKTRNLTFC